MTREEFEQYAKENGLVVWSKEMSEKAIKALEQEPIIDKIRAEINKLTVYYTTKDKGINLISQNAVNRIFDKYKADRSVDT